MICHVTIDEKDRRDELAAIAVYTCLVHPDRVPQRIF